MLNQGIRWKVGNGRSILVYKDIWIPRPDTFKLMSSPFLPAEAVVADIMDVENKWDLEKLQQHFMPEDVEAILRIPLLRRQKEDELMWDFDKRREYSVKIVYQQALKFNSPNEPSSLEINSSQ